MSRSKNLNAMDNHVERLFYYTDLLEETYRGFCHSELDARNSLLEVTEMLDKMVSSKRSCFR